MTEQVTDMHVTIAVKAVSTIHALREKSTTKITLHLGQ